MRARLSLTLEDEEKVEEEEEGRHTSLFQRRQPREQGRATGGRGC
jgi:hypothetical protein